MSGFIDSQFQVQITGSFTAVAQSFDLSSPNSGTTAVQITGTWSGTLVVEGSNNNSTFVTLQVMNISTFALATSITASGLFIANTNGFQYIRIRSSAWTSGTAVLTGYGSDAASIVYVPGVATAANQTTELTRIGDLTETAPATDTASSGLNGRLQRIAQRITSLIALIPSVNTIAWFSRISDGTNNASVTAGGDLTVNDGLSGGGLDGSLSVPTAGTAVEVKVGGSRLANRKFVSFQATSHDFFWGFSNTVTTANGELIKKGATARWAIDASAAVPTQIWVVCASASASGRAKESP